MRRLATALALLSLGLAACGGGADAGDDLGASATAFPTPSKAQQQAALAVTPTAAPAQSVPLDVRRQLEGGAVGLFDVDGATSIKPSTVQFAADADLEDVTWSTWGADGATGSGTMRSRDCNPNCAEGKTRTVRATVTLSAVKVCKGQRYFSRSAVAPQAGETPRSYLRAPC